MAVHIQQGRFCPEPIPSGLQRIVVAERQTHRFAVRAAGRQGVDGIIAVSKQSVPARLPQFIVGRVGRRTQEEIAAGADREPVHHDGIGGTRWRQRGAPDDRLDQTGRQIEADVVQAPGLVVQRFQPLPPEPDPRRGGRRHKADFEVAVDGIHIACAAADESQLRAPLVRSPRIRLRHRIGERLLPDQGIVDHDPEPVPAPLPRVDHIEVKPDRIGLAHLEVVHRQGLGCIAEPPAERGKVIGLAAVHCFLRPLSADPGLEIDLISAAAAQAPRSAFRGPGGSRKVLRHHMPILRLQAEHRPCQLVGGDRGHPDGILLGPDKNVIFGGAGGSFPLQQHLARNHRAIRRPQQTERSRRRQSLQFEILIQLVFPYIGIAPDLRSIRPAHR